MRVWGLGAMGSPEGRQALGLGFKVLKPLKTLNMAWCLGFKSKTPKTPKQGLVFRVYILAP